MYPWYKSTFERFGWMVLANHYKVTDNVTSYKKSLDRLCDSICEKLKTVHDEDNKADLIIMQKNVEILIRHAKRILNDLDRNPFFKGFIPFTFHFIFRFFIVQRGVK